MLLVLGLIVMIVVVVVVLYVFMSFSLSVFVLLSLLVVIVSLLIRSTIRVMKRHLLIFLSSCCRVVGRFLPMWLSWWWICPSPRFLWPSSVVVLGPVMGSY